MQSRNGGWGAFDVDNTHYYLNHIPFADHGALLDPPTADVTARCLGLLAQRRDARRSPGLASGARLSAREQEDDGCWFGRWGTNYIYGTWSVLAALNAAGIEPGGAGRAPRGRLADRRSARMAAGARRRELPGRTPRRRGALQHRLADRLGAAGADGGAARSTHPAVARGIAYLIASQDRDGNWDEPWYTAVGFPRVFYLRYHGYRAFFPLWALARYRRLSLANSRQVTIGI